MLLRRAIENLLENAHAYSSDPESPIHVTLRRGGSARAVVEVRDEGVGIAPDDLAHVFEPFFRADRSRSRATGGVGLGLALVQRIAEAHGGEVTLESELGRGTTASLALAVA